mgnify:CR=1 FL=1
MADVQEATSYVDIFDKCDTDEGYFGPLRHAGDNYFTRPVLPPKPNRIMEFQGEKKTMWSVNNYLGLADHPAIKQAALEAATADTPEEQEALVQARAAQAVRLDILSDPFARPFYIAMGAAFIEDRPSKTVPGRVLPWLEHRLG